MSKSECSPEPEFRRQVDAAVAAEWRQMINEGTKYGITDMQCGDEGPAELRARLEPKFRDVPLSQIRRSVMAQARAGKAAKGERKTSNGPARVFNSIHTSEGKRERYHTPEYTEHIGSKAWADRAREHKRWCDFQCQVCGRVRVGDLLEVHHVRYDRLGSELSRDLLCVCKHPCHMVVDFMRNWGKSGDDWSPEALWNDDDLSAA